jgi:hypothetical protein
MGAKVTAAILQDDDNHVLATWRMTLPQAIHDYAYIKQTQDFTWPNDVFWLWSEPNTTLYFGDHA